MNELFAEEDMEMESPKLKWMRKHKVSIRFNPVMKDLMPYEAFIGTLQEAIDNAMNGYGPFEDSGHIQCGHTEHDALCNLAEINGWKLWNEE